MANTEISLTTTATYPIPHPRKGELVSIRNEKVNGLFCVEEIIYDNKDNDVTVFIIVTPDNRTMPDIAKEYSIRG